MLWACFPIANVIVKQFLDDEPSGRWIFQKCWSQPCQKALSVAYKSLALKTGKHFWSSEFSRSGVSRVKIIFSGTVFDPTPPRRFWTLRLNSGRTAFSHLCYSRLITLGESGIQSKSPKSRRQRCGSRKYYFHYENTLQKILVDAGSRKICSAGLRCHRQSAFIPPICDMCMD